jgi:hypothetical protein
MIHISPKNSCFFENLAEAALVGFVEGSVCADLYFGVSALIENVTNSTSSRDVTFHNAIVLARTLCH